jgi:hypothetical protein
MMKIFRNFGILILSLCCLTFVACGDAEGPSEGGSGSDVGSSGETSVNIPIKVGGYEVTPTVLCWGNGMNEEKEVPQAGTVTMTVPKAPDTVVCNVVADGIWTVTGNGVCSNYTFTVSNVEITTWTGQANNANYQFNVGADGSITPTGRDIDFVECTDGTPPPIPCASLEVPFEFSGHEDVFPGASLQMGIGGDHLLWTMIDLNAGPNSVEVCADNLIVNIKIGAGNYAPNANGVCDTYEFKVNDTVITTGDPNGQGSYNYSFELLEDGTVVESGDTLPVYDCSGDPDDGGTTDPPPDPTVSCEMEIIYLGTYTDPTPYIDGGGIVWGDTFDPWIEAVDLGGNPLTDINGDTIEDADGNPGLVTVATVYPDSFIANMSMIGGNQTYLVGTSILAGESFYINGVLIENLISNGQPGGGMNLNWDINDTCAVVIDGVVIEPTDPDGDTVPVDVVIPLP